MWANLRGLGYKQVMVTQIFHRHVGSYTHNHDLDLYNARVDYVNSELLRISECDNDNDMVCWAHSDIMCCHSANLVPRWGASWPGGDA